MEGALLIGDKPGEKSSLHVGGLYKRTSAVNVLRGELLVQIPGDEIIPRNDGNKPHNYRVNGDSTISLYCDAQDVVPLGNYEFLLLESVKFASARFALFHAGTILDWGQSLKPGDKVYVTVPGLTASHVAVPTSATPRAAAKVRFVGGLGTGAEGEEHGIFFGVEILDNYRGWGTTDGTYRGSRYFTCEDNCGLFVSLDKLSRDREGSTLSRPPPSGQARSGPSHPPSSHAADMPQPAAPEPNLQRHPMTTRSKVPQETNLDHLPPKQQFAVGERVVVHNKQGAAITGTVRWTGIARDFQFVVVGIETDIPVRARSIEGALSEMSHLFTVKTKGCHLFMPEALVSREAHQEPSLGPSHSAGGLTVIGGVKLSEADITENHEAYENLQKKLKEDLEKAMADESINLTEQREALQQFEEQEKQRAQQRVQSHNERYPFANAPPGQFNKPHPLPEDRVRALEEQLSVPSVPELRKAQSLPYGKLRQHQYEDMSGHRLSGGLEAAVQGNQYPVGGQGQPLPPKPRSTPPPKPRYPPDYQPGHPQSVPLFQARQSPYEHGHRGQQMHDPLLNPQPRVAAVNERPDVRGQQLFAAFTSPPGADVPVPHVHLTTGSMVQLSNPPWYGVIRWVGDLPAVHGLVAGIEMESPIEGGTDGTWKQTGVRYFECEDRKGMFAPLHNLKPDQRFAVPRTSQGAVAMPNPLDGAKYDVQEDAHIAPHPTQLEKYLGEKKGIQGHQNSCYLDATVFGLFALSDAFDEVFLKQPADDSGKEICKMFWKGIVNPLRTDGVVRYESVMAMRNKLEDLGKMKGVNHAEKDPEEFLNMLFKYTLDVEPFISIKRPFGVEKEFFVQLFVEFDERQQLPSVGSLLIKMYREQNISFTQVPARLLIQVPRYGKKFKTYQKILPALKLDVKDVLSSSRVETEGLVPCYICNSKPSKLNCSTCAKETMFPSAIFCESCYHLVHDGRAGHDAPTIVGEPNRVSESGPTELELLSVICIETSHYVCFARSEDQWVFFDSMANRVHDAYNIPKGVDCTKELNEWVYGRDHHRLLNTPPRELPECVRRLVQDVYMCVYTQPDIGMYG